MNASTSCCPRRPKGTRSRFIDRAILRYIETHSRESLRERLKAGYRANAERDLAIAAEWFPLEEEAFHASENLPKKKYARSKRT